tara:strand:- start:480 stop:674 length:195 start_codon:yes stop_codon:yes gene_type:complete
MQTNINGLVLAELEDIADKIAANPFSTVSVSFTVQAGEIVRVKRGMEVQAKTGIRQDRVAANGQ